MKLLDTPSITQPGSGNLSEENRALAHSLDEVAELLESQNDNPFRVKAYLEAADELRQLSQPIRQIWENEGREGLLQLPHIGASLATAIETWLATGTLGILLRLRGEETADRVFRTIPGIGPELAHRIHQRLGITSLADLERAAMDNRLTAIPGIGPRRLQLIRAQLDNRLRGARRPASGSAADFSPASLRAAEISVDLPGVAELLEVDQEYCDQARADRLPKIAPRRFNPTGEASLPILHTHRGDRHYTALFSNTTLAHQLGQVRDWVVLYLDDGASERQWTVVTEQRGPNAGKRVIRGHERECAAHYRGK